MQFQSQKSLLTSEQNLLVSQKNLLNDPNIIPTVLIFIKFTGHLVTNNIPVDIVSSCTLRQFKDIIYSIHPEVVVSRIFFEDHHCKMIIKH